MSDYILHKATRILSRGVARPGDAYTGPACQSAGIVPGLVYPFLSDAKTDAKRLKTYNPVGFDVYEIGQAEPIWSTEARNRKQE